MTIEDCISKVTEILEEVTEDENAVCYVTDVDESTLKTAIDTMRKYQLLQANYENRLKADLEAILTDLYMKIEELDTPSDDSYDACIVDCERLVQQKINALKGEIC